MKVKKYNADKVNKKQYWLLYSLVEGDEFKIISFSKEQYQYLLKDNYFDYRPGDYIKRVYPSYALLVKTMLGHDFILDQFNGKYMACGTAIEFKTR